jgi:hypothetical protein
MACGSKEREFMGIAYRDTMRLTTVVERAGIQAWIHELVPRQLW